MYLTDLLYCGLFEKRLRKRGKKKSSAKRKKQRKGKLPLRRQLLEE